MKYHFFSIIIPVYENISGLRRLLASLSELDYPDNKREIIVVDNNSRQKASSLLSDYPEIVFLQEAKQGSYAARNKGVKSAKGEILAFTDSDCVVSSDWLSAANEAFQKGGLDALGGGIEIVFEKTPPNVVEYLDAIRFLDQESYVAEGYAATANLFIMKDVFEKAGGFDGGLLSGGDYEFTKRLTGQGYKLCYGKQALVFHRARNSFSALLKKSKRTAIGQKQLRKQGKRKEQTSMFRLWLPRKTIPHKFGYLKNFTFWQKILIFLGFNLLHYHSIFYRYL